MYRGNYTDLAVWQKSIHLVDRVYQLTKTFPKQEQFGLVSQMRRCAVSISLNIAEGNGREYTKDFIRFLNIAFSSCLELETIVIISTRQGYIDQATLNHLSQSCNEIKKMLYTLIKSHK